MTIEELKKEKLIAFKNKDIDNVSAYNAILTKLGLLMTSPNFTGKILTDADIVTVCRKVENELKEERAGFEQAGRFERVQSLNKQIDVVKQYIPEILSKERISEIILSLDDKSTPAVMKYFKANYAGKVDMRLVNEILKELK